MPETKRLRSKIALVGDLAVGKTSLIRRFVADEFDDHYLMTLGTKVSKKALEVALPEHDLRIQVDLSIWDIMGQPGFRDLLQEAFFTGAHGVLAVADVTRRPTLDGLEGWIRSVVEVAGPVPVVITANKADVGSKARVTRADMEAFARSHDSESFLTSAKTGENAEAAFRRLSTLVARAQLGLA